MPGAMPHSAMSHNEFHHYPDESFFQNTLKNGPFLRQRRPQINEGTKMSQNARRKCAHRAKLGPHAKN